MLSPPTSLDAGPEACGFLDTPAGDPAPVERRRLALLALVADRDVSRRLRWRRIGRFSVHPPVHPRERICRTSRTTASAQPCEIGLPTWPEMPPAGFGLDALSRAFSPSGEARPAPGVARTCTSRTRDAQVRGQVRRLGRALRRSQPRRNRPARTGSARRSRPSCPPGARRSRRAISPASRAASLGACAAHAARSAGCLSPCRHG